MKLVIAASLAAVALGALGSVYAQGVTEVVITGRKAPNGAEVQSKTVKFADLDLSKQAGVTTLARRIRGAARDVCQPAPLANDVGGSTDYKKCVSQAANSAAATVNNPSLTAMIAGH